MYLLCATLIMYLIYLQAFFRRFHNVEPPPPCLSSNGKCNIWRTDLKLCQFCRIKKCKEMGMSIQSKYSTGGNVWGYDFCYGEELTIHIIYMPDVVVINSSYIRKIMQTTFVLIVSKWCVPTPVLIHF